MRRGQQTNVGSIFTCYGSLSNPRRVVGLDTVEGHPYLGHYTDKGKNE
jgi:hypothetical protein